MRFLLPALSVLALAACETPTVERQQGVGFQNYTLYQQQQAYLQRGRSAIPTQPAIASSPVVSAPVPVAAAPAAPVTAPQSIAADTLAALGRDGGAAAPQPVAGAPLSAIAASAPPAQQAPAAAVPLAPVAASGSNIVAFALSTSHPIGQQMYRRSSLLGGARFQRACAGYASDGLAQEAFLAKGGPERDALGLDPDGDGYACNWNPAPFRNIRS